MPVATKIKPANLIGIGEQFPCPVDGCIVFPYDRQSDIDEHVASGDHLFKVGSTNVKSQFEAPRTFPTGGQARPDVAETRPDVAESVPEPGRWAKVDGVFLVKLGRFDGHEAGATVVVEKASGQRQDVKLGVLVKTTGRYVFFAPDRGEVAVTEFRWTKVLDKWLVRGPKGAAVGSTITIVKADKSTVQAVVLADHGDGLYSVERKEAAPAPGGKRSLKAACFALRDRVVEQTGAQTLDRSLRVCVPATVLGVDDQPDAAYLVSWSYAFKGGERHVGGPGAIRTINLGAESTIKLIDFLLASTPEEFTAYQAAYGQHFHQCGRCGSPLSDEKSKLRGLGPDCFAR